MRQRTVSSLPDHFERGAEEAVEAGGEQCVFAACPQRMNRFADWNQCICLCSCALYFRMTAGRCIGLVGGLGVGAAVYYYTRLAEMHEKRGAALGLVMVHAETSEIFRSVRSGDRGGLAKYLAGFLDRLAAAG